MKSIKHAVYAFGFGIIFLIGTNYNWIDNIAVIAASLNMGLATYYGSKGK